MIQKLLYNITGEQTLHLDVPEGRPSSITSVEVFEQGTGDDGTAESATTGSASVETNPNTTFDSSSGDAQRNPNQLHLAATTGITVGRRYLATNAEGQTETVLIDGVTSGASALSRHPLKNDYESGDSFESTRISISVDDTWIADETNISDDTDPNPGYRVRWTYVVGGSTYVQDTYFNVVRYRAEHDVTAIDVSNVRTGWLNGVPTEGRSDRGQALIDEAYAILVDDLHAAGIAGEMLRNRRIVNRLTIYGAIMLASWNRAAPGGDQDAYEIDRDVYSAKLDKFIHSGRTDVAVDTEGAGTKVTAVSFWEK